MHLVTNEDPHRIKHMVRDELAEHGISHATIEIETENEHCHEKECHPIHHEKSHGHHHHHH